MKTKRHLLVIDPTAYAGGSKVATENILRLLNTQHMHITVLTADPDSWHWPELKRCKLYQPKCLSQQEQGIAYFLRHFFIAFNILLIRLRFGKINIALGASGPGVDLALYLVKPIMGFSIVQLVHGPVACSRTIGKCLYAANEVHYLESCSNSLLRALSRARPETLPCSTSSLQKQLPEYFHTMKNGLSEHAWPCRCYNKHPTIFWAASLLKWKGLDTLLNALKRITPKTRPETHICYIQPKETTMPISHAPVDIQGVHWYEAPENLDLLRGCSNIFVSTSHNEPFGLSILEAMAAGHCVLIPDDGAYWDRILKNEINCIKYTANDARDLANKLLWLSHHMERINTIGEAANKVALNYRAHILYADIKDTLEGKTTQINIASLLQTNRGTQHHVTPARRT